MAQVDGVRLLKVDIGDWDSPVARQFRLSSIPALRLYDGQYLVSQDVDEVLREVAARR